MIHSKTYIYTDLQHRQKIDLMKVEGSLKGSIFEGYIVLYYKNKEYSGEKCWDEVFYIWSLLIDSVENILNGKDFESNFPSQSLPIEVKLNENKIELYLDKKLEIVFDALDYIKSILAEGVKVFEKFKEVSLKLKGETIREIARIQKLMEKAEQTAAPDLSRLRLETNR